MATIPVKRRVLNPNAALAILAMLATVPSPGWAQRPRGESTLDARIDRLVGPEAAAARFSGMVLVAKGDRIVVQRAYGFADWERNVGNTPATRFGIASITKLLTEALVDVLASEGRLDLDAPVSHYINGFPDGPKGGHATVRDLVTHRAGVPHRVTTELDETGHFNPAEIVDRVKVRGLLFEPGSAELYSSAGFTCLARILELVEDKPFDSILAERVFRPASMGAAIGETGQQLMKHRALPYVLERGPVTVAVASAAYKDLSFLTGAGSVYATAGDLLHFIRALKSGTFGPVAGKLLGVQGDTTWANWYGRTNGYEASLDYLPSNDITVVLLSNLRSGSNWQIRQRVRNIVLGRPASGIAVPPPVAARSEDSSQFAGLYGDPADPVTVGESGGRFLRDDAEFYPIAGGRYYIPVSANTMRFSRDSSGNVAAMLTRFGTAAERSARRIGRP